MRLCISLLDLASDLERRARLNFTLDPDVRQAIGSWSVDAIAKVQRTPPRLD